MMTSNLLFLFAVLVIWGWDERPEDDGGRGRGLRVKRMTNGGLLAGRPLAVVARSNAGELPAWA